MRSQFELQQAILGRARELGLTGQLPGFQGNVPVALKAVLADSNITSSGATGWMDSLDPNYGAVADVWMRELLDAFGSDHYYQLDGYFNGGTAPWLARRGEMQPDGLGARSQYEVASTPSGSSLWRRRMASAFGGLNRTDPKAVWSYQGFAFEGWKHTDDRVQALRAMCAPHIAPLA